MPEPAVLEKISIGSAGLDLRRRFGTAQVVPTAGFQPRAAGHTADGGAAAQLPAYSLPQPDRAVSPFAAVASSPLVAAAVARQQPGTRHGEPPTLRSVSLPPIRPALSSHASAEALARYSLLQRASVQSALEAISHYTSLRTSAGPAFVDARNLIKVGDLGSGAYATVEHCQLANWRDPSQHGPRGGGGALAALEQRSLPPGLDTAAEGFPLGDDSAPRNGAGGSGGGSRRRPSVGRLGLRRGFGGRGGSGRGVRSAPGRRPALLDVAVKHLRPSLFDCQADLEDFVREAVLLATLQHRSIVGVLGVGFSEAPAGCSDSVVRDSIFMVTELCRGGSLREKVLEQMIAGRKVVYTYSQGLQWCAQVADGLAFLHAQSPRIIHRDVKLDNVLLSDDGNGGLEAKLADFGLHATVEALNNSSLSKRLAELVHDEHEQQSAAEDTAYLSVAEQGQQEPASKGRPQKVQRSLSDNDRRNSGEKGDKGDKALRRSSKSSDNAVGGSLLSKVRSLVRSRGSSGAGVRPQAPPPQMREDSPGHNLTGQTGSFLGMAPEVTLAKPYDEQADVFSLGCVITDIMGKQLTSSEVAYHGTIQEFQRYAMRVAYGYRRPMPGNWAPELRALVESCLAQRPADRPPAAEVAARLRGMADAIADMDMRMGRGMCGCLG